MVGRLLSAKQLFETMRIFFYLDPVLHIFMKFEFKYKNFRSEKLL